MLRARGVMLNAVGLELFEDHRFTTKSARETVGVACLSVAALGLETGATYEEVVGAALSQQLVECSLELGPYLRLVYLDQTEGAAGVEPTKNMAPPGSMTVASRPLDGEDSTPKGFYLRRIEGALWLRGYRASPSHIWNPDDVFVFTRRSGDV